VYAYGNAVDDTDQNPIFHADFNADVDWDSDANFCLCTGW
jgi:hypothetical protein